MSDVLGAFVIFETHAQMLSAMKTYEESELYRAAIQNTGMSLVMAPKPSEF